MQQAATEKAPIRKNKSVFDELSEQLAENKLNEYLRLYGNETGAEQDRDFMLSVIRQNLSYANAFKPALFERCRNVVALFAELNRSQVPLSGHRVKIVGDDYMSCDSGILDDIYSQWEEGGASVCAAGSAHLCSYTLKSGFGAPLSISGGPHHSIDRRKRLESLDVVRAHYWFWGERPCGNGGIYISVDVKRWLYRAS